MNNLSLLIPFLIYNISFSKKCYSDSKGAYSALSYLKMLDYKDLIKFVSKYETKFSWEPKIHKYYPFYGYFIFIFLFFIFIFYFYFFYFLFLFFIFFIFYFYFLVQNRIFCFLLCVKYGLKINWIVPKPIMIIIVKYYMTGFHKLN